MATDLDLAVTISANAEGVSTGMADAQAAVEEGGSGITSAATAMAEGVETSTTKMHTAFQRTATAAKESAGKVGGAMSEMSSKAKEIAEGIETTLTGISNAMSLVGEVKEGSALGEALTELAEKVGEFGEKAEQAAEMTGMSAVAMQQLNFAASMSGVSADVVSAAMGKLASNMAKAKEKSGPIVQDLKELGINAQEFANMKPEEALKTLADAFNQGSNGLEKMRLSQALFNNQSPEWIAFMNKGAEGMEEMASKASTMAIVLGDEDIQKLAQLKEQMTEAKAVNESVTNQIGASMAPSFASLAILFEAAMQEGGTLRLVLDSLAIVFRLLVSVVDGIALSLSGVVYVLNVLLSTFSMVASSIVISAQEISVAIKDMLHPGDIARDTAKLRNEFSAMMTSFKGDVARMTEDYTAYVAKVTNPIVIPPPKKPPPNDLKAGGKGDKKSKMKGYEEELAATKEHF